MRLDLVDAPDRWTFPDEHFDVAFLCAAVTSQLDCARDPERTHRINVAHTVELATRLVARGTFVVFVSTSLVFDGEIPYAGTLHPYNPQSIYGKQKAEAEQKLLALGTNVAVVRLSKVIGPSMPLIDGWKAALAARTPIHPFADRVLAPISLPFTVEVLHRVAQARRTGITHASASDEMTYAEAAGLVAAQMGADSSLIQPVEGVQTEHAFAPRFTTLDATSLRAVGLEAPRPERAFDTGNRLF
jgi:dTDP-4-dehydrorhamnose reductase